MSKEDAEITRKMQRHLNKHRGNDTETGRWKTNKDSWEPYNYNKNTEAGKGDSVRPYSISHEEYGLRYDLAIGKISVEEFEKELKKIKENK